MKKQNKSIVTHIIERIKKENILKSALYSARIEGNNLTLKDVETILLPPRQEELYYVIRDHNMVSFDFLRRRFLKIPPRTLRYDLKKLSDKGFIVKIGKTKGSFYNINK